MIQFCKECYQEVINAPSWITPLAQSVTALAAVIALVVALKNLKGLKRNHTLQAQMNLISLENEIRKNLMKYKIILDEYSKADLTRIDGIMTERLNAFELFVSSADKLAALIIADYVKIQFPERDWQNEYRDFFNRVKRYHTSEDTIIPEKDKMMLNVDLLLTKWGV
jgi:hypothetical protein